MPIPDPEDDRTDAGVLDVHLLFIAKTHMSQPRNTTAWPSRRRHIARVVTAVGTALVAFTAACNDAPSAPAATALQPAPARLAKEPGGPGKTVPAGRKTPLAQPITVRHRIDPRRNSKVEIKEAGLEIEIPQGAVASPVEITVTALPGHVAYEFQPHGLVFRRPLQARQDLKPLGIDVKLPKGTSSLGGFASGIFSSIDIPHLEVSYFTDASAVTSGAPVSAQEFLGSVFDLLSNRVEFDIHHFSGYMVSWGRSRGR